MDYVLKERIGNPDLFTGRKEELAYYLKWINDIKQEKSQSSALLARRKMGKTALMERLFNITFYKNDGIIPFYYEIKESQMWVVDFCQDFFLTFIYQYIAFKTRQPGYLKPENKSDFGKAVEIAKQEGLDYLCGIIEGAAHAVAHEKIDILWNLVREAPQTVASQFKYKSLKNMPEDEAVEMVFKHSRFFDVPVSEETAYLIAALSEGSPFYISSIIRSEYEAKDLTTIDGLVQTLEFETLDAHGVIKGTWMEYVKTAFSKVNDRNAKRIVLHLCKHKDRELTRKELLEDLNLDMPDEELEEKLEALVKADIIKQGQTNFDYRCVGDNIFDKVFRGVYQKEIEHFEVGEIKKEYSQALEKP